MKAKETRLLSRIMADTRAETVVLAILELIGLVCAVFGLYVQYMSNVSLTGMAYCSTWYVIGGISHLFGLIAIILENYEEEGSGNSQMFEQWQFFSAWLTVVLGYPLMVTFTWMILYPHWSMPAQAHILLAIIPVLTFIGKTKTGIARTTLGCTLIAAISHFVVCFLANDVWGYASALVMLLNIIALDTPSRYHLWAFSSIEVFIMGLIATTVLMNYSIIPMGTKRR